jgi:uncharacterized membrane protein YeiH
VFAASGALSAGRKSLDVLGVLIIAALTAIGGGTIRDLLLDRHPIFWVENPVYMLVIVIAVAVTLAWTRRRPAPRDALLIADALGLALFAISGARIAMRLGLPWPSVILMGTITGTAGGVLRDLLSAEIPLVLRRDIYVTAAIAGIAVYLGLAALGLPSPGPSLIGAATVVALRLAAIVYDLHLPSFKVSE